MERLTVAPFTRTFLHDQPAKEDLLGRLPFAKALSRSLPLPEGSPGLVVGIEGSWGSGKSTLIELVTKELASIPGKSAPLVVFFNPWMVSTTGALVESLVSQIAVAVGIDASAGEKGVQAGQKLLSYITIFSKLKYLKYFPGTGWAGNIGEALDGFIKSSEELADTGGKTLEEMKKILPTIDLAGQKKAVITALEELGRPIIIIIDDLDRLLPNEIQAMVQAIKSVADFPRTTYLLAYDRAVVASALGSTEAIGTEYLAKIVQVAYPIPPLFNRQRARLASKQIHKFLLDHQVVLASFEEEMLNEAISILAKLLPQPRDILRLVNRLILSVPATRGEVNIVDVIVFEALSMRYPALREAIYKNSHEFAGKFHEDEEVMGVNRYHRFDRSSRTGTDSTSWKRHLPANEPAVVLACEFLFSKKTVFSRDRIDYLRIADPYRLARFLRMTSIEGVPELSEINDMLSEPSELATELASCDAIESLKLLTWICHYAHNCRDTDIDGSIRILLGHAKNLDASGTLDYELINQIGYTIDLLIQMQPDASDTLLVLLAEEAPLGIAVTPVVKAHADRELILRHHGNSSPRPSLSDSAVDRAVDLSLSRLREWIRCGAPGSSQLVHLQLQALRSLLNSDDEVHAATTQLCHSDDWLLTFIAGFSNDPRHTRAFHLVADVETLAERIENVDSLANRFAWLINSLRSDGIIEMQELRRSLSHQ